MFTRDVSQGRFQLVQVGRSVPRGLLKLVVGLALMVLAIAGTWWLAGLDLWLVLLIILPAIWLVDWGAVATADGATDLIARARTGTARQDRAMLLDRTGVQYSGAFTGQTDLRVPWSEVSGAGFWPGPGGALWFCLAAEFEHLPRPSAPPRGDQRGLSVTQVNDRCRAWVLARLGPDAPTSLRRETENLYFFDTPLAINLEICRGAQARRLDRAIRVWSEGRCRCRPPYRPWWQPPNPKYLRRLGFEDRPE